MITRSVCSSLDWEHTRCYSCRRSLVNIYKPTRPHWLKSTRVLYLSSAFAYIGFVTSVDTWEATRGASALPSEMVSLVIFRESIAAPLYGL